MPIPKTEAAKSKMVKRAIARRPNKFPKHSKAAGARKVLAEKVQKQGKSKEDAYAIATAQIEGTTKRRRK